MTDREKLTDLIREAHKKCKRQTECHECEVYGNGSDCVYMFMANLLIENGVTVQKWIPVTERLPESLGLVVALTIGGNRIIAQHDRYGWLRYGGYEAERLRPITHWMPLPEPPKD